MGWASGSDLLMRVWREVREYIPEEHRVVHLANLMNIFADDDCDTLNELIGPEFPEAEEAYELFSSVDDDQDDSDLDDPDSDVDSDLE